MSDMTEEEKKQYAKELLDTCEDISRAIERMKKWGPTDEDHVYSELLAIQGRFVHYWSAFVRKHFPVKQTEGFK